MPSLSADTLAGPQVLNGSPYFELKTTSHGGRSLFAISDLEQCARIDSCEAPFTHVVYKDYRKEVCAQCFSYSASDYPRSTVGPSRTWSIKWSRAGAATAWFCSEDCKGDAERDEASPLLMEVNAILTKGQIATRKNFKSAEEEVKVMAMLPSIEYGDKPITQRTIDAAWESAEALAASKAQLSIYCSTLQLEDMELEIARVLAAAIVRRHRDDVRLCSSNQTGLDRPSASWAQLLDLQKNELCNIQTRPHLLAAHLRVYVFLCNTLPKHLRKYVSAVREVLARDTGNAFGIWDGDEMIGWGIWVSASYFNHSASLIAQRPAVVRQVPTAAFTGCTPNVRKKREGRVLHFEVTRRVLAGEELCISYIDTDSPVDQRRRELEESWFFTCRCLRCEKESSE